MQGGKYVSITCNRASAHSVAPTNDNDYLMLGDSQDANSNYLRTTIVKKEQTNKKQEPTKPVEQKLYIKALADTWIKVVGDDKKLFESILYKDKTFETTTKQEFNIKIGNIDGIEVYFNDKIIDISKGASNSKVNTLTLKRD